MWVRQDENTLVGRVLLFTLQFAKVKKEVKNLIEQKWIVSLLLLLLFIVGNAGVGQKLSQGMKISYTPLFCQ